MTKQGPLAGLRGVVLTQAWAGTFATQLLGLLGAEIIQVEARQRLDSWRGGYGGAVPQALRATPTAVHPWNTSPLYNAVNLNKQTVTLNLARPEGIELFKRLVPFADFVAENFSPRVMGNLGLDYASLKTIREDVILISMSAYGATGPYANIPGIGGTIEPMAGMSWLLGYEDGPPINSGQMYPDPVAGYYGAAAVLIALHHRERTGEGQHIDLSMQEANMTFVADALMEYSAGGRVRTRMGNRHTSMAPHNIYPCRPLPRPPVAVAPSPLTRGEGSPAGSEAPTQTDQQPDRDQDDAGSQSPDQAPPLRASAGGGGRGVGAAWIAISAAADEEFVRLCRVAGRPEWSADPRFADVVSRKRNERDLDALIGEWTADHDAGEIEAMLQAAGVTAARVRDARDVLESEHLWQRETLAWVEHSEAGRHAQATAPWRLSRTPGGVRLPSPCLGEHCREVLARFLDIADAEYERLVSLGITGGGPPD